MIKSGKAWGLTMPLLQNPFVEVHDIHIEPNMKCSMHRHKFKWNAFYVISGAMDIVVEKGYGLTDVTTLKPGDFTTVKPGEYHRFETADQPCHALEIYYPEALSEDIERRDHGGRADAVTRNVLLTEENERGNVVELIRKNGTQHT